MGKGEFVLFSYSRRLIGNCLEGGKTWLVQSIFKKTAAIRVKRKQSGLFRSWLRFGSVTGFFKPAPSPTPRQNPKILAPNGYSFSSNAQAD